MRLFFFFFCSFFFFYRFVDSVHHTQKRSHRTACTLLFQRYFFLYHIFPPSLVFFFFFNFPRLIRFHSFHSPIPLSFSNTCSMRFYFIYLLFCFFPLISKESYSQYQRMLLFERFCFVSFFVTISIFLYLFFSLSLSLSRLSISARHDLHVLDVMQGGLHLLLQQFVFLSLGGKVVWKDHRLEGGCTRTPRHKVDAKRFPRSQKYAQGVVEGQKGNVSIIEQMHTSHETTRHDHITSLLFQIVVIVDVSIKIGKHVIISFLFFWSIRQA